eukprot:scaffold689_cov211-Skeletonema_menzelii.AAC.2
MMLSSCLPIFAWGCAYADFQLHESHVYPFCRQDVTMSDTDANITRRAEANDPLTMLCQEGLEQAKKGNIRRAFEYLMKAESDKRMGGSFFIIWKRLLLVVVPM